MTIIFLLYSKTIDITHYTIKDIPGSSGRLDVISRCILAALIGDNQFDENIQIWVFLDKLGTYIFNPIVLDYEIFPKNELKLTDYFVDLIRNKNAKDTLKNNPLRGVSTSKKGVSETLTELLKVNYKAYLLHEEGVDFFSSLNSIYLEKDVIFIVGNQSGDILNLEEMLAFDLPFLSFGNRSYLASSVIRLLKLHLLTHLQ